MNDLYSIKDVAKIFGLQESRLRYWAQTGFVNPSVRRGGRVYYTFRDLINVRAAKELIDAGVSMQKVRKNLESLRALLPDVEYPASKMHILSDGETIVAREDDVWFEPLTGQLVMNFSIDAMSREVADILALPTSTIAPELPAVDEPAARATQARVRQDTDPYVYDREAPEYSVADPVVDVAGSVAEIAGPAAEIAGPVAGAAFAEATPSMVVDDATQGQTPLSSYRWFLQGCEAEDRSDTALAERAYRQALRLQPTLAAAHTNLGNLLYRRGDARGARSAYERALELEPGQPEARYNLGNVLEDMGETELAIAELRRVCWTHPDFADAHYNLGLMLARVGGISQAQEHLARYVELDRTSEWAARARTFLSALG